MSCLKILRHFETTKPLLNNIIFLHSSTDFHLFSNETFYNSFCRQSDSSSIPVTVFYTFRGAWRHGTKLSKLEVAGMTSNCFMRHSKCGWNVVNQVPKTIPIDFPAYQKCIGINHQQLEICGIGLTEFPSISTKIGCDGICRTNMNQR